MKYHVLLLDDVTNHGRKGDLVHVAPGFARNHLLPKNIALLASKSTIKLREKLQKERAEQAEKDKAESLRLAKELKDQVFETIVKVDPEGHMYGSVTAADIVEVLKGKGIEIAKKSIAITHPIRQIGTHHINLKLPEDVEASVGLEVKPDREIKKKAPAKKPEEEQSLEEGSAEAGEKEAKTEESASEDADNPEKTSE